MKVRTSRIVVWGAAALVLVSVALALQPGTIPADVATVERGPLQVTLDEEGETRVRDRYMVSAPLAGRVLRIDLEPGDPVTADETILATFQPADPTLLDARSRAEAEGRARAAGSAVERARADRTGAEAALEFAENELERQQQLAENGLVSRDLVEAAVAEARTRRESLRAAEFAVATAEHELEVARATLYRAGSTGAANVSGRGTIVLTSPIDGVVLRRLRESEAIVPVGEPLLEIADPARLEIVSDMLSADAVKITGGDSVRIEQWGGDGVLRGRVRRVEPFGFTKISALGVEEQRVNVIVDFEDAREAWEALGDGYRVEIRVVIWERDDILTLPTSALFRTGDAWSVYRVENDVAVLTEVDIGQRTGLRAEVLEGLDEGDRIVIHPSDDIADGTAVEER